MHPTGHHLPATGHGTPALTPEQLVETLLDDARYCETKAAEAMDAAERFGQKAAFYRRLAEREQAQLTAQASQTGQTQGISADPAGPGFDPDATAKARIGHLGTPPNPSPLTMQGAFPGPLLSGAAADLDALGQAAQNAGGQEAKVQ